MSAVVWLDGGFVDRDAATFSIDDPGALFGEGLRETMRATDGVVPWLQRHLSRLRRSADALHLAVPDVADVREAIMRVASALGSGTGRVTAIVTTKPTILVTGVPVELDPAATLTAVALPGTWFPGNRLAEHKTLSFLTWRDASRRAALAGADTALLLDRDGNLGEAALANVFCVVGGRILTAPVDGILPGVTRDVVLERCAVEEAIVPERVWRHADEMFVTSAVRHVVPIVRVDGRPVGTGLVGPVTLAVRDALAAA